jgi:hypothetical protein
MRLARPLATGIDPQSRQVLRRLGCLVLIFALWSGAFGPRQPLVLFSLMTLAAACVEGAVAAFCRETLAADRLGRWDWPERYSGCTASRLGWHRPPMHRL